jgi:hypothetical protein
MPRDEFVAYPLERYASPSQVPIREHVAINSVVSWQAGDSYSAHRLATFTRMRWSSRPVPISVRIGQRGSDAAKRADPDRRR